MTCITPRAFLVFGLSATLFTPAIATSAFGQSVTARPAAPINRHPKLSPDTIAADPGSNLAVIVQYVKDPGTQHFTKLANLGAQTRGALHSVRGIAATVPASQLSKLEADPEVAYVSIDRPVHAHQAVSVTGANYTAEPINAPSVWAEGYVGTNIGVAVIDSGITPVADLSVDQPNLLPGVQPAALKFLNLPAPPPLSPAAIAAGLANPGPSGPNGRIVYSQNFAADQKDAKDYYGHGTHVAGLIAGNGAKSLGKNFTHTFYGIAPNANLINLRVLDANGAGSDSQVIAAIEQAISLKSTYNIRVINLSLGRPIFESYTVDPLCQAVEQAWKAGIVVVVAAGNDGRDLNENAEGYGTINAPGNDPYVITVGATNPNYSASLQDDTIASYSSKGPSFIDLIAKPDIVAPGNLVSSLEFGGDPLAVNNPLFITQHAWYQLNGDTKASSDYFPLSGTSMATGVASGAVADLLQANPLLTPDQVKALLMVNADRNYFPQTSSVVADGITYMANYDVFTVGAGYLDVNAAINGALTGALLIPAGTAMSPQASFDPTSGNTTLVLDSTVLWGRSTAYGPANVYGSNAFIQPATGAAVNWANTVLWGRSDPNAFSALWGSTVLWGRGTPDAATVLWGRDTTSGSTVLWGRAAEDANGSPLLQ